MARPVPPGPAGLPALRGALSPELPVASGRHAEWAFVKGRARADFLRPRLASHLLLIAVVLFFVAFLVWARLATLDEVSHGIGQVVPSSRVQVIQNLEGGILAELKVREGEVVEQGQVLARIENVRTVSEYRASLSRSRALEAAIARLAAEVDGREPSFPPELMVEAPDLVAAERRLFATRRQQYQDQQAILERQLRQRRQELDELRLKLASYESSYALAREELDVATPLARQRVIARTEYLRLQRSVNDLEGALEQTRISIPRAETAIEEAEQRLGNLRSTFLAEAQAELTAKRAELATVAQALAGGLDQLRRSEVRAPLRGTVKQIRVQTIGGVLAPGAELMDIVPLEDTLLVEARVSPADIAFIRRGLPANVKITAYDYTIYGSLKGRVEDISADTLATERGETFYRVRVRTDANHLGSADQPLEIIPGMTAQVDIQTGEKTVLDYLLKPILRARSEALRER
jgi:adhesin transport system membrane fusion protein